MTNSNGNQDDELETVKQILMTVARSEDHEERMSAHDQRMEAYDRRMEEMDRRLTERLDRLTERVDRTTVNVDNLAAMMVRFAEDAAADRATIRGLQTENRQILEYLFGQQRNGNGGGL